MARFFVIKKRSKKSKARVGEIRTAHGTIRTPAFVPVATKGTIKALPPQFINDIGIQAAFVNTYHLVTHPGGGVIEAAGGIHKFANLSIPLMSDSGGFQVFSLAQSKTRQRNFFTRESPPSTESGGPPSPARNATHSVAGGKVKRIAFASSFSIKHFQADIRGEEEPLLVKISEDGVSFRSTYDGTLVEFTPEKSIKYQQQIGADLMMAFDECIYYGSSYDYSKKAAERTHRWLERCIDKAKSQKLKVKSTSQKSKLEIENSLKTSPFSRLSRDSKDKENWKLKNKQYLYGIIQGGVFEDLRKKSAEFVASQSVDGVAIGGVSVGETKKEMRDQVRWVADYLPKDKPVHLLGVGQFDDIVDLVKFGIDTFDCVEPTRLARVGRIYQWRRILSRVSLPQVLATSGRLEKSLRACRSLSTRATRRPDFDIDILKGIYKKDLSPVDEDCECYTCQNFTKAYLHHLFKQKEILGYALATYHNLWVMERFFQRIREMIFQNII